jgi:hypothetical protein
MLRRFVWMALAVAVAASAQKYDGPAPPKPICLISSTATRCLPTEAVEAKQENKKGDALYTIDGAASSAKTPLASPILIMKADKILPQNLQLFRFDVKNGHRELNLPAKRTSASHPHCGNQALVRRDLED